jgi:HD-GYP domain-containing protein (c-di-GMP phosphodiesterase class II)
VSALARTLTVCDVYGALVEHRSYKPAKPPAEALYVLISMAQQGKIDFRIVRSFADAIGTVLPQGEARRRAAS